jgi:hypothetical protein
MQRRLKVEVSGGQFGHTRIAPDLARRAKVQLASKGQMPGTSAQVRTRAFQQLAHAKLAAGMLTFKGGTIAKGSILTRMSPSPNLPVNTDPLIEDAASYTRWQNQGIQPAEFLYAITFLATGLVLGIIESPELTAWFGEFNFEYETDATARDRVARMAAATELTGILESSPPRINMGRLFNRLNTRGYEPMTVNFLYLGAVMGDYLDLSQLPRQSRRALLKKVTRLMRDNPLTDDERMMAEFNATAYDNSLVRKQLEDIRQILTDPDSRRRHNLGAQPPREQLSLLSLFATLCSQDDSQKAAGQMVYDYARSHAESAFLAPFGGLILYALEQPDLANALLNASAEILMDSLISIIGKSMTAAAAGLDTKPAPGSQSPLDLWLTAPQVTLQVVHGRLTAWDTFVRLITTHEIFDMASGTPPRHWLSHDQNFFDRLSMTYPNDRVTALAVEVLHNPESDFDWQLEALNHLASIPNSEFVLAEMNTYVHAAVSQHHFSGSLETVIEALTIHRLRTAMPDLSHEDGSDRLNHPDHLVRLKERRYVTANFFTALQSIGMPSATISNLARKCLSEPCTTAIKRQALALLSSQNKNRSNVLAAFKTIERSIHLVDASAEEVDLLLEAIAFVQKMGLKKDTQRLRELKTEFNEAAPEQLAGRHQKTDVMSVWSAAV